MKFCILLIFKIHGASVSRDFDTFAAEAELEAKLVQFEHFEYSENFTENDEILWKELITEFNEEENSNFLSEGSGISIIVENRAIKSKTELTTKTSTTLTTGKTAQVAVTGVPPSTDLLHVKVLEGIVKILKKILNNTENILDRRKVGENTNGETHMNISYFLMTILLLFYIS